VLAHQTSELLVWGPSMTGPRGMSHLLLCFIPARLQYKVPVWGGFSGRAQTVVREGRCESCLFRLSLSKVTCRTCSIDCSGSEAHSSRSVYTAGAAGQASE
jgi:hypothetical protein